MRKIVVSTFVTLDGVMEAPQNWSLQFWNDEHGKYAYDLLFASDALLMGRETYEGFASAWPSRTDGFADRINHLPNSQLAVLPGISHLAQVYRTDWLL